MEWVSVSERLPESRTRVLAFSNDWVGEAFFENFNNIPHWYTSEKCCGLYNVTHWMPLPQKPKETK